MKKKGYFLILVQNGIKEKFGGFFTHNMMLKSGFFGTGESFLFRFYTKSIKVYKSS